MANEISILAITRLREEEMDAIRRIDPSVSLRCSVNRAETAILLPKAQVVLASGRLDIDVAKARHLKWVHFLVAGLDQFLRCKHCGHQLVWNGAKFSNALPCNSSIEHETTMNLPGADILITTSSGIAAIPIAEYVFAVMLSNARGLPVLMGFQREHRWIKQNEYKGSELHGKTLGIVGLGHIGRQVAQVGHAFGMRVLATRRSLTEPALGEDASPADSLYHRSRLEEMFAECDYVLLSAPLTAETEGSIGERQLRAMKRSAVLINISRGRVIDEGALARALREGWIAGAAIDVAAQEPLDPTSPLWDLPNLLLTPHISAVTDPYLTRAIEVFCDNVVRFLTGQPLLNVLDRARGY